MHLTLHSDYALRVLMYLGLRGGERASVEEIATAYGISAHHLTKVAQRLSRGGFVETLRGRGGGLHLARPPEEIRIGAVFRFTEEDLAIVDCLADPRACGSRRLRVAALAERGARRLSRGARPRDARRPDRTETGHHGRRLGIPP